MKAEIWLEKGMNYLYGLGDFEEDYEQAMKYFIKALDAGSTEAMNKIGYMYQCGYGVVENKSEAVKWYKRGAKNGDSESMNSLADCFLKGIGIEQNIDAAINWYRKAAELGNYRQVKELAVCLIRRSGSDTEAYKWLKKSCDKYSLLWLLRKDSVEDTDLKVMSMLADIYSNDLPNTKENKLKAFKLYEKIAEKNPKYCSYLASMYYRGCGVEKNLEKYFEMVKKAADAGNASSMREIAEMYLKGEFVSKDESKAIEWLTRSYKADSRIYEKDEGFTPEIYALRHLADIYYADEDYSGHSCDKSLENKKRAFELFQEMDELGYTKAKYRIARMYERGEYVKQDKLKALEIYKSNADKDSGCCRKVIKIYLEEKNILEAAKFIVKYFNTANKAFCTCPLCSPFEETKEVAKFFIDTPNKKIIKMYDNDKNQAAQAIFDFGKACMKSPVNVSICLEIISIAADIMGSDCSRSILKYLAENYEKIYQDSKEKGVPEEVEGDAAENLFGRLTESLSDYLEENDENYTEGSVSVGYSDDYDEVKFEHHDADYYKYRSIHYQIALAINDRKFEDIDNLANGLFEISGGNVRQLKKEIKFLVESYDNLYRVEVNPNLKSNYNRKSQKWSKRAKQILNGSADK